MIANGDCATGCDARERFTDGRNCAQAVLGALSEVPGLPEVSDSLGAGFTTGIGGSGCVCGALAAGVSMLGAYAGTLALEPVATRDLAGELSARLHKRFVSEFGTSCCRVIKRGQTEGSDEWLSACASLTETTAGMVADIVAEHAAGTRPRRWVSRDVVSLTRRAALGILSGGAIAALAALLVPGGSAGLTLAVGLAVIALAAVGLELGGERWRRAGRVLRGAGGLAAGLLGVVALILPNRLQTFAAMLLTPAEPAVVVARVLLVGATLAVAATGLFGLKRYR